MALRHLYSTYLTNPSAENLSDNASLHYITTLTSINTSAAIVKHNTAHKKILDKKEEKILQCIESDNAVSLDMETTLEFVAGGGAYLPGLDDNFVADRTVTFPMIHIVQFDQSRKIQQIRLYWDQGSLLKQIDVIGARARNWPIRDGKDQARLIATSAAGGDHNSRPSTAASNSASREAGTSGKPRSQSTNVTRDPHASLALFAPRDENDDDAAPEKVIAPKASAKPTPRDYHDLFGGNDSDASLQSNNRSSSPLKGNGGVLPKAASAKPPPRAYHDLFQDDESPNDPKDGPPSPNKADFMSPPSTAKGGAGKNFKPSRLFDVEENDPSTPMSPEKGKYMKPHPTKYHHFEFGDGDDAPAPKTDRPKTKHQSQWNFEDFATPQKPLTKARPGDQDKRHFAWGDDEGIMESPAKHPAAAKPRPDATANFEFQDDGTPPAGGRRTGGTALGGTNVRTTGLYQNNILGDDDEAPQNNGKKGGVLAPVTNLKDRRKDFDRHFDMSDASPTHSSEHEKKPISDARAKVVSQMGAQWEATDSSPGAPSGAKGNAKLLSSMDDKENLGHGRGGSNAGIKSGGDGMGGKKGATRSWGFGEESDGEENVKKFQASKKQQAPRESLWDF